MTSGETDWAPDGWDERANEFAPSGPGATKPAFAGSGLVAQIRLRRGRFMLDVALGVPAGVTALLGPSGAGKSLTLQAIAGLAEISDGRVTLSGRTLTDSQARVALPPRLRRVGYVPQSYALFPHLSVAGNIGYSLPWRMAREERARIVGDLLKLGRLEGYERRRPRDLSGGEAQRVAALRALAAKPDALLLDEPFSALDAPTRVAVRDDLGALIAASGLPTLLVTHDLSEAVALASRLALLVDGRIAIAGPTAEALATPPTWRAARLLGWGAALDVAGYERLEGTNDGALVTLACGQRLALASSLIAADALTRPAAELALALRLERLLIARADGDAAEQAENANVSLRRDTLCGVITASGGDAALTQITLDGVDSGAVDGALALALTPRERATLALADGARVTLRALPGALRLLPRAEP